jgi:hypothetical protein
MERKPDPSVDDRKIPRCQEQCKHYYDDKWSPWCGLTGQPVKEIDICFAWLIDENARLRNQVKKLKCP